MLEEIRINEELVAILIGKDMQHDGIRFFTPPSLSQQLAFMSHPAGKTIKAHVHNRVERNVEYTQEVLFIRRGKLRIDFYDKNRKYYQSRVAGAGDVLLLIGGGHGFQVLEDVEMFEVKQGPYVGEDDKTQFEGVAGEDVRIGGKS